MKKTSSILPRFTPLVLLVILSLSACNLPNTETATTPTINATQAMETVIAKLTEAVGETPSPTATQTMEPPSPEEASQTPTREITTEASVTPTEEPTATQTMEERCDQAAAAYPMIDISIPDDTEMVPGQSFTKIWRVVNVGTCTWTTEYSAVWFSGTLLGTRESVALEGSVAPNQSIDISVDMVAPDEPGSYRSNWKLSNPDGEYFGIGPNGESPFWVQIIVLEVATDTPTPTPTVTATPPVQASGPVTLVLTDTLDLDTLTVNEVPGDLAYLSVKIGEEEPTQHQLIPQANILIGIFGADQPTITQCQAATMGADPMVVDTLTAGTYLCYRTDLGLPGWARFENLNPENFRLNLEILTWSLP
jgi:hypothetical protein